MNDAIDLGKYRKEKEENEIEYDFSNEFVNARLAHFHKIIDLIGVNRLLVSEYLEWRGLLEMVTIKKTENNKE